MARPLWHCFPTDQDTWDVDTQFMWGEALLISPVLEEGAVERQLYLPPHSRWYHIWNSDPREVETTGHVTVSAPLDTIPLHVRGGHIIPGQVPGARVGGGASTEESRKNGFGLIGES